MNNYNEFNNQNVNTNMTNIYPNQISPNEQEVNKNNDGFNNNKGSDKKLVIIIISLILIILALIVILIANLSNKEDNTSTTTTTTITTTEKVELSKELIDETSNVSVKINSKDYFDKTLVVKTVQGVKIENAIVVYDINLTDENNNVINVEDTNLLISVPYDNVNNYNDFKVLYLDNNNNVLETLNARYQNNRIVFEVTHLSRYAIVGTKVEEQLTTTKKTTTQKTNTTKSTTQKPNTTQSTTKVKTTLKSNTTKKTSTTQKPYTTQSTTKPLNKYTIVFDSNGGSQVSNQIVIEGNTIIQPNIPQKEGFKFMGWKLNNNLYDFSSKVYKNMTLVASWEETSYLTVDKIDVATPSTHVRATLVEGKTNYFRYEPMDGLIYDGLGFDINFFRVSGGEHNFEIKVYKNNRQLEIMNVPSKITLTKIYSTGGYKLNAIFTLKNDVFEKGVYKIKIYIDKGTASEVNYEFYIEGI